MKRAVLLLSIVSLLSAPAAFAQHRSVDVIGYATWVDLNGDSTVNGPQNIDAYRVNFESDTGFGAAVNVFFTDRISTEFAASVVEPDVNVNRSGGVPSTFVGSAQMIPITATLQFHLAPNGTFDPYIGGGAAYVLFDDVNNGRNLSGADIQKINLKDDVGFVVNGGVSMKLSGMFGLNADVKYVPVKSSAHAVFATGPGENSDIDVNPLMVSAGVRLSF